MKKGILISILLIAIDQISKFLAITHLKGTNGISIIDGVFKLQYLENRGAAFGIFEGRQWFLLGVTILLTLLLAYVYTKINTVDKFSGFSYCIIFIFAGAIGNLIDRIYHGFVVDFLYFELIDFAIFNIADSYITVSVVILFALMLFKYKEDDIDELFSKVGNKIEKVDGNEELSSEE